MYATDDLRWDAVQRRDRAADGAFLFAVKTTGALALCGSFLTTGFSGCSFQGPSRLSA